MGKGLDVETMQCQLNAALALIRPVLQQDGGDLEIVECTPEGIVRVRLQGQCKGCPKSRQTLSAVVERTILKMVPQVRKVEAVD